MRMTVPAMLFFAALSLSGGEEILKNGDFSKEERGWDTEGTSEVMEGESPVLKFTLDDRDWSYLSQEIDLDDIPEDGTALTFEAKASVDYQPVKFEKGAHEKVDYTEKTFVMMAEEHKDNLYLGFQSPTAGKYQGELLEPGGDWKKVSLMLKKEPGRDAEIIVAIPPGKGSIEFRNFQTGGKFQEGPDKKKGDKETSERLSKKG